MKEEKLEALFRQLQGSFDSEEPRDGHRQRFLEKLQDKEQTPPVTLHSGRNWWRPMAIAASVVLLCMLGWKFFSPALTVEQQMANISPEFSNTEFYFASLIEEQVRELESASSPETRQLVDDTLLQLKKLEQDYGKLEMDLLRGGNSQLILSAMITNFQTRIELLKDVLEKIETIKSLKIYEDENYTI